MKAIQTSRKKLVIAAALAFAMVTVAVSQGSARMWENNYGPMMSRGMMGNYGNSNTTTLTTEQRSAAKTIEVKYQAELNDKEAVIRKKVAELQTAQTKDDTTFGNIKALRSELYTLEQDYWTLRDKVNQEISQATGSDYYGNMGWGPGYCDWHNDHQGMYGGASHMYSQRGSMMGNGSNWCNW